MIQKNVYKLLRFNDLRVFLLRQFALILKGVNYGKKLEENVKQIWTASGEFLSTVQLENETVDKAMEEYYHNISKGDIEL